nr:non-structural protein NS4a [Rio Bravo virus]
SGVLLGLPRLMYQKVVESIDMVHTYYTADPNSRNFKLAEKELPDAFLCILQSLLMIVGVFIILMWILSRTKVDRIWIGTLVIGMSGLTAWYGGVPLPVISGGALVCFVLLICLVPEEGMQR